MLCVIAKIDETARAKLIRLQKAAERSGCGMKPLYGHITLAAYRGGEEGELTAACKAALDGQRAFSVYYNEIAVFSATSMIAAVPQKSGPLLSVYQTVSACFPEHLNEWTRAEVWQPHTMLLYHPSADLFPLAVAMRDAFAPFSAHISRIEFSRVEENEYTIIDSLELPHETTPWKNPALR